MASRGRAALIVDGSLGEKWTFIAAGGFGGVYTTRHLVWKIDVAIKLLHIDDGSGSILREEAERMQEASSPFVLPVLGVYQGCPPVPQCSTRMLGLVMENMKMGSVEGLQRALRGPPPWPLAWRLAHQVALGINYLHSLDPPLLHRDLKTSNVLLDDDLNAKLTDFGLSMVSTSVCPTQSSRGGPLDGTVVYMPPESFKELAYKPVRAYDIYSYGILLWSTFAGKSPYPDNPRASFVEYHVSKGHRPDLEEIKLEPPDGREELLALMKKCWDQEPSQRPPFADILEVTERVYSKHTRDVPLAVCQVLSTLNPSLHQPNHSLSGHKGMEMEASYSSMVSSGPTASQARGDFMDFANVPRSGALLIQDSVEEPRPSGQGAAAKAKDKKAAAKFVDDHWAQLIQDVTAVMAIADDLRLEGILHSETYAEVEAALTSQSQMRKLQKPVLCGGVKVKSAFYRILRKHEHHLVAKLESPS